MGGDAMGGGRTRPNHRANTSPVPSGTKTLDVDGVIDLLRVAVFDGNNNELPLAQWVIEASAIRVNNTVHEKTFRRAIVQFAGRSMTPVCPNATAGRARWYASLQDVQAKCEQLNIKADEQYVKKVLNDVQKAAGTPGTSRQSSPAGTDGESVPPPRESPAPQRPAVDGDGDAVADAPGEGAAGANATLNATFNAFADGANAHRNTIIQQLDAATIAATTPPAPPQDGTMADHLRPQSDKVNIDPTLAVLFSAIRPNEALKNYVPPSTDTQMLKGTTDTANAGHTGFASYDLQTPLLTKTASLEAASSAIKRAILTAKTCVLLVRDPVGKSTLAILSGVPPKTVETRMSDRRVRIYRLQAGKNKPTTVRKGSILIREVTMRVVGSKEDVNAFATEAGVRWSFARSFERNNKTQMHAVGGMTAEQAQLAMTKNILLIPDACVTADYCIERMITVDFKRDVGPEQAQQFMLQFQREHNCMTTILMFRGRILMTDAVTAEQVSALKDKYKNVLANVRCPALGRVLSNKRPEQRTDDDDNTISAAPPAVSQEHRDAMANTPMNAIIANKVAGDASPYMTSNQADTLEKELRAIGQSAKKVGFDGHHAMYVVPKAVLKALQLDDGQPTAGKPDEHFMHFELADGTVLAVRPYKTHQKMFEQLRARREQSLANNAAASTTDTSHA